MDKTNIKESLIDFYGLAVYFASVLMIALSGFLAVIATLYIYDAAPIEALAAVVIIGVFVICSNHLIRQIE